MNNPYASPSISIEPSTYYKSVPARATFRELRRLSPNVLMFGLFAIVKVFRLPLPINLAVAVGQQQRVPFDEVPAKIQQIFREHISEFVDLGYSPAFALTVPIIGSGENYALVFLGPRLDRVAGCLYSRSTANETDYVEAGLAITSRDQKQNVQVTTSSMHPRYDAPQRCLTEHYVGWSASDLDQRHTSRLENHDVAPMTLDSAWQILRDNALSVAEYQYRRGLLAPITDDEHAALVDANPSCAT